MLRDVLAKVTVRYNWGDKGRCGVIEEKSRVENIVEEMLLEGKALRPVITYSEDRDKDDVIRKSRSFDIRLLLEVGALLEPTEVKKVELIVSKTNISKIII